MSGLKSNSRTSVVAVLTRGLKKICRSPLRIEDFPCEMTGPSSFSVAIEAGQLSLIDD